MQKVKVHRYVTGKRPDYAPDSSGEEESEEELFTPVQAQHGVKLAGVMDGGFDRAGSSDGTVSDWIKVVYFSI